MVLHIWQVLAMFSQIHVFLSYELWNNIFQPSFSVLPQFRKFKSNPPEECPLLLLVSVVSHRGIKEPQNLMGTHKNVNPPWCDDINIKETWNCQKFGQQVIFLESFWGAPPSADSTLVTEPKHLPIELENWSKLKGNGYNKQHDVSIYTNSLTHTHISRHITSVEWSLP